MEIKEADEDNSLKVEKNDEYIGYDVKCEEEFCDKLFDEEKPLPKKPTKYFWCPDCDLSIVKSSFFVKHVEKEHSGKEFLCSKCSLHFATGALFTDHVYLAHRKKAEKKNFQAFFECAFCDQQTVKSTFYVKHMVNEHPGKSLQCSFCEMQFETGELFLNHVKTSHKKNKGKIFKEDEVFPCVECKKIFSKLANLDGHKRAVHNIQVQVCEFCCKEFKNKDYCRQHIRLVHESQLLDSVDCDVCGKVFKSKSNLYHHKRAVHEVAEDLICYICATKCKNSYGLRKHLKKCQVRAKREPRTYVLGKDTHIEEQGLNFFCSKCNKTFFTAKALRSHNRAAHTFDPLNCHICNRECKNVDYLKQHYRRGHYITDADQIIAMVKFVKPDYEPASSKNSKKKDQDPYSPEMKPDEEWCFDIFHHNTKPSAVNSESQKTRQELVNKWREMEEEQRRMTEAEEILAIKESDNINCDKEDIVSSQEEIITRKLFSEGEDNLNYEIAKLEEGETLIPECDVKIEVSGSECSSTFNFNDVDSVPEVKEETVGKALPEEGGVGQAFSCSECGKSYKSVKYLTSHIRTVHTVNPCTCPHCNANFKNSRYLCQHLQRSHKFDSKSAKEQSLKFSGNGSEISTQVKVEVTSQQKDLDINRTEFSCTDCSKVFTSKSRLSTHTANMHVVGEYLCQLCGEKFTLKQQLKNHTETVHTKADGLCQFCSKTFKYLSSHIKDVHMKDECICPHCAKSFHNKKHLNGHLASVHSGEGQTRICPVCSKQFKNSQYLRQHVRLVHETVEDISNYISCDECGKQFANKAHLYHHTRAVHVVENINCSICGRTYKNKTALGKHLKHAHDGMVKNPYSDGANPISPQPGSQQDAFGSSAATQNFPFQSRAQAYPRSELGQPGWF